MTANEILTKKLRGRLSVRYPQNGPVVKVYISKVVTAPGTIVKYKSGMSHFYFPNMDLEEDFPDPNPT